MRKSCFRHICDSIFCPERCDIHSTEATSPRGLKLATPKEGKKMAKVQKALKKSDNEAWATEQSLAHEGLIGDKDQSECYGHHDLY